MRNSWKFVETATADVAIVANLDKVILTFDMPTRQTADERGMTIHISTSNAEESFTVALCCNVAGDEVSSMVIFKVEEKFPKGAIV